MQWLNELYQAASMASTRGRGRGRLPASLLSMPIEELKKQLEPSRRRRRKSRRKTHKAHHHAAGKYCARCGY